MYIFLKQLTQKIVAVAALTLPLSSPIVFAGDEYYRWVDETGTVTYGAYPPEGVDATVVDTYGRARPSIDNKSTDNNADQDTNQENLSDEQQQIIAQRREECEQERKRLATLKSTGRRIQMTQPDGSTKYLSPEEIAREIKQSSDFLEQACN